MTWQEYQDAVAELYEQLDDLGTVSRSDTIKDKVTGQARQIDVLIEMKAYQHALRMVVDAKFHSEKIDVKDVEEVLALADAVKANQVVIVAANGWTEPAGKKAEFHNCSLRLFTLEDALDQLVPNKWEMCPNCKNDCIVLDMDGAVGYGAGWLWWLAGRCRECKHGFIWCQDCGEKQELPVDEEVMCGCGHAWRQNDAGLTVRFDAVKEDDDLEEGLEVEEENQTP
jgi:Restriction endonuclease